MGQFGFFDADNLLKALSAIGPAEVAHIKPLHSLSERELADTANRLYLAPHIHMLFDKGLISIDDAECRGGGGRVPPLMSQRWVIGRPTFRSLENLGAALQADGETRSVEAASSIKGEA
jgi:hypothetical protein